MEGFSQGFITRLLTMDAFRFSSPHHAGLRLLVSPFSSDGLLVRSLAMKLKPNTRYDDHSLRGNWIDLQTPNIQLGSGLQNHVRGPRIYSSVGNSALFRCCRPKPALFDGASQFTLPGHRARITAGDSPDPPDSCFHFPRLRAWWTPRSRWNDLCDVACHDLQTGVETSGDRFTEAGSPHVGGLPCGVDTCPTTVSSLLFLSVYCTELKHRL